MPWTIATWVGRVLIAVLFVPAGVLKIVGPKPFLDHMAQHHVPGALLPAVAALELAGAALVLSGWQGRWGALALALFCVATAFVFHLDFGDKAERTLFAKDLAIAGGLFILSAAFAKGAV
jgi:putative oxidoreductase